MESSVWKCKCLGMYLGLAGAIFALGPMGADAATFYVSQVSGNDGNAGTSASAPWKNCPGMSAYSGSGKLNPGDSVYFDRSNTWPVSGTGGIFLAGGVTYIGNSWGSGTAKAHLQATTAMDSGVVAFTDHPTIPTIFQGFNVDANGQVTSGVNINWAHWWLQNGATKRVQDCEVHNSWSRTSLNQYQYGLIISNHGGTGGYCENVEILNCVVHDTSRDGLCIYPGDEDANCRVRNITIRGCEVYNTGQDPDYGAGSGILVKGYIVDAFVEYNYVHNTKGAMVFVNGNETNHYGVGPTNIHLRYNTVTGNNLNGGIRIYDGHNGADPKDIKVYGNLIYNSTTNGGFYIGSDLGNTLSLLVYNNTFYNSPVLLSSNDATVTVFEFKNNVVYYNGGIPLTDSRGMITSHSNNIFYRTSGTLVTSKNSSYTSANLKAGYESTASSSDPLYKNTTNLPTGYTGTYGVNLAPNNDGLSLQQGSPGMDKGVALVSTYAGSVNSVARPSDSGWDIGAYEFNLGSGNTPLAPTNLRFVQ
jgi:hypothetical protein